MSFFQNIVLKASRAAMIGILVGIIVAALPLAVNGEEIKACLDCHPGYYDDFEMEFNHAPFEQEDCYSCHRFHGFRNAVELDGPIRIICGRCHVDISEISDDFIHQPIADEDASCTNCHDPHSSEFPGLLSRPVDSLCTECHDSPADASGTIHAPYGDASCIVCHDPHGSPFGSNFLMPPEYICLECHVNDFEGLDPGMLHAVDEEQGCDKCHNGHESSHRSLLKAEPEQLCLDCHASMKAELETAPKHSILEGEDCLICHKPHFMLSGGHLISDEKELCLTCHDDIAELMQAKVVHAAVEDNCTVCHNPHLQMSPDSQSGICADCHDLEDESFIDSHYGLTPGICTDCHNPHGSSEAKLIRPISHVPFAEGECDACHDQGGSDDRLQDNELCLDCHDFETEGKIHSEVDLSTDKCLDCHASHASKQPGLLRSKAK